MCVPPPHHHHVFGAVTYLTLGRSVGVPMTLQVITALQTIVSRSCQSRENAVLTVAAVSAGAAAPDIASATGQPSA